MAQNGNDLIVYYGTTAIARTKSNDVQVDAELIEVSSPLTGLWEYYITGRKSGSISVSYLVVGDSSAIGVSGGNGVRDLLQAGNSFTLKFKQRGAADSAGVSGTFILETVKITAQRGALVQGSFQFKLNGELS